MKAFLLRLALATAALSPVTAALAADLEPPPPVDDLRPATFDWTGFNIGIFGAVAALEGNYDATQICDDPATVAVEPCAVVDPEMSGVGYGFGLKAGYDWEWEGLVLGIAGDWMFGGELADNDDPAEATYLEMNHLATLRGRVGFADDRTLLYATGGLAAAEMEFGALVGPGSVDDSAAEWTYGWTAGGGIEHAFSDYISVGLEYLYIDLDDTSHFLSDGAGISGTIDQTYDSIHTIRASVNYRFSL
jgi:outer membrane immunogenic protein